jgi:SanA protein
MTLLFFSNYSVEKMNQFCYDDLSDIPTRKVGLVLGTAKTLKNGRQNLFYKFRVDAAANLYKAGKVKYLLISGDNSRKEYDEPSTFKSDLIKRGVPAKRIYLDYAGFRTLDSMVRCKEVFGENKVTVISQPFHNKRAIYIGLDKGMDVIGYNAKKISGKNSIKTNLREYLARVKTILDLNLLFTQPKYLGGPIKIK